MEVGSSPPRFHWIDAALHILAHPKGQVSRHQLHDAINALQRRGHGVWEEVVYHFQEAIDFSNSQSDPDKSKRPYLYDDYSNRKAGYSFLSHKGNLERIPNGLFRRVGG